MTQLQPDRPIETHKTHSRRLMKHAREQLEKGDRLQAAEKSWGAVAHSLKIIARERGEPYRVHSDARRLMNKIAAQSRNKEAIRGKFAIAEGLHRNFYEDTRSIEELTQDLRSIEQILDLFENEQVQWKAHLRDQKLKKKDLSKARLGKTGNMSNSPLRRRRGGI